MHTHRKFPKIRGLHYVVATVEQLLDLDRPVETRLTYRAKVKLHGTNMGVRIYPDGRLVSQSRNADCTTDGYNFPQYIAQRGVFFRELIGDADEVVIFGEWAGPGIQKGVSVNQMQTKAWFVFGCLIVRGSESRMVTEPAEILAFMSTGAEAWPDCLHVIPWHGDPIELDFRDPERLERQAERLNSEMQRIDTCDPLIADLFGIEGTGEGMVMYPLGIEDLESWGRYAIKVKGESHKPEPGSRLRAQTRVPVSEDVLAFIDAAVSPARVSQGMQELFGEGPYFREGLGALIKWVSQDLHTECDLEAIASGLQWSQINRNVAPKVREIYFDMLNTFSVS